MQHAVIAVVTVREAPDHLVQGHFIPRFHIYAGQVRVSGQVVTVADYDGIVESLHEDNLGDIALEYRTYFRAASRSDIDALVVYHQTFLCGVRMDAVAVYDHASADGIGQQAFVLVEPSRQVRDVFLLRGRFRSRAVFTRLFGYNSLNTLLQFVDLALFFADFLRQFTRFRIDFGQG